MRRTNGGVDLCLQNSNCILNVGSFKSRLFFFYSWISHLVMNDVLLLVLGVI